MTAPGNEEVRRTHPLSPVVHGLGAAPAGAGLGFLLAGQRIVTGSVGLIGALAAGMVISAAVVTAVQWVVWTRTTFWFDTTGDLHVASGLVERRERRLQLSRLQSVDVSQPLAARVLSMASVKVEAAGSGESHVTLAFLPRAEAESLRTEIIARSRSQAVAATPAPGAEATGTGAPDTVAPGSVAPEAVVATNGPIDERDVIARVETSALVASLLLRSTTVGLFLLTLLVVGVAVVESGVGGLPLALITGGVPLLAVVGEYNRFHGFTVAESPDGLRTSAGLTNLVHYTIPPGRVHAIDISQGVLWRAIGWVRVELSVAGTAGSEKDRTATTLMPVAERAVALDLVRRVLPGVDPDAVASVAAPSRARWRAPVQWRRISVGADDRVTVVRRGRLVHHVCVVPHERVQSVRLGQGPWQRALRLAAVHVDTVPGPVRAAAPHLDETTARAVLDDIAARARLARRAGS